MADLCGQESNYAAKNSKDSSRAAKNADEADRLTNESYYDTETGFAYAVQICELRRENYEMAPALNTAGLMRHAALDCLYFMGMVREDNKNSHMMDTSIFNKENAIVYGDIDAEGFLQARSKAIRVQNYRSVKMRIMVWHSCFIVWAMPANFFRRRRLWSALGLRQCFIANALWMMRKVMKMALFPVNSTVLQNTPQLYLKKWMQS